MFRAIFQPIDEFLKANECILELERRVTDFATTVRTAEEREQKKFSAPNVGVDQILYNECYAALSRFSRTPRYMAAGNRIPSPYTVYGYISDHFSRAIATAMPLELLSSPESFVELWSKMRSMSSMFNSLFRPIQVPKIEFLLSPTPISVATHVVLTMVVLFRGVGIVSFLRERPSTQLMDRERTVCWLLWLAICILSCVNTLMSCWM
jgi:hypothetical protein